MLKKIFEGLVTSLVAVISPITKVLIGNSILIICASLIKVITILKYEKEIDWYKQIADMILLLMLWSVSVFAMYTFENVILKTQTLLYTNLLAGIFGFNSLTGIEKDLGRWGLNIREITSKIKNKNKK